MSIDLANAPVSWGVDYPDDPGNPSWPKVMDEIALAGYRHTELGPYGYYPADGSRLQDEFGRRGLAVVAGFVFQPLHDPSQADTVLDVAKRTVDLLAAVGGTKLVTIDHISEGRMRTAGQSQAADRLDAVRFRHMIDLIDRIADAALKRGITPVVHPHAACFIEFEDEIEAVAQALDPVKVGFCVDTGHLAYAGLDPVRFYEAHADRVKYFHFKDIDPAVHGMVVRDAVPFLEAVARKVFCPMGRGVVDWPALAEAMKENGYGGAANVEQDIDPAVSLTPLDDAKASLAYLRSVGF